jgi:hypothetical protein
VADDSGDEGEPAPPQAESSATEAANSTERITDNAVIEFIQCVKAAMQGKKFVPNQIRSTEAPKPTRSATLRNDPIG